MADELFSALVVELGGPDRPQAAPCNDRERCIEPDGVSHLGILALSVGVDPITSGTSRHCALVQQQ
jgi:hypothetical protein